MAKHRVVQEIMLPRECAELLGIQVKSLAVRADKKQVEYFKTPGGHRRYPAAQFKKKFKNLVIQSK